MKYHYKTKKIKQTPNWLWIIGALLKPYFGSRGGVTSTTKHRPQRHHCKRRRGRRNQATPIIKIVGGMNASASAPAQDHVLVSGPKTGSNSAQNPAVFFLVSVVFQCIFGFFGGSFICLNYIPKLLILNTGHIPILVG